MLRPTVPPLAFSSVCSCSAPSFRLSSPVDSPLLIVPLLRIDLSNPRCSGSPLLYFIPIIFRCFSSALSYLLRLILTVPFYSPPLTFSISTSSSPRATPFNLSARSDPLL